MSTCCLVRCTIGDLVRENDQVDIEGCRRRLSDSGEPTEALSALGRLPEFRTAGDTGAVPGIDMSLM
ncbi:MAG: hypothetical protein KJ011_03655 [Burkholderiaceae bacterium]|nr:hypothetical protein [Burkholderiaceae bacterium]